MIKKNSPYILKFTVYAAFALLFFPFLKPLMFAILFAFALSPIVDFIKNRFKMNSDLKVVFITIAGASLIFFLPVWLLIVKGIFQIKKLQSQSMIEAPMATYLENLNQSIMQKIHYISETFGFDLSEAIQVGPLVSNLSQKGLQYVTSLASEIPVFMFQYLIFIVALFLILKNKKIIFVEIESFKFFSPNILNQLKVIFQKVCSTVLVSALVVSATQALIISLAALMTGQSEFLIIFVLVFFMAFIPVIGSVPVSIVLISFHIFHGNYGSVIVILGAAVLAGAADNIIRTIMVSDKEGAHPFVALLALIGAISIFGFSGLFLGPILCELAYKIHTIFDEKMVPNTLEE